MQSIDSDDSRGDSGNKEYTMYVVITGSFNSMEFYGPFDDWDYVNQWVSLFCKGHYEIVKCNEPCKI